MKRPGTFGFSSTFIFATVARPSYSTAIASTVGARRRQGPHHSAQKSTSVTPFMISLSKLLSVKVLTFSDAILSPWMVLRTRPTLPPGVLCHHRARHRAFIYFDVLAG